MTAIIARIRFFQWQGKSGLTIIGTVESYYLRSEVGVIIYIVIITEEEPTYKGS